MTRAPWSFSRLTAADCLLRFRLHYIDHVPEPPTPPLEFGAAAHEFFAEYGRRCVKAQVEGDADLARRALDDVVSLHGSRLDHDQVEDLHALCLRWAEGTTMPKDAGFELNLAIDAKGLTCSYDSPDAVLRGRLDMLEAAGGGMRIVDRKTNWSIPPASDRKMQLQGDLYALLVFALVPKLDTVEVELDFARHGVRRARTVTRDEAVASWEKVQPVIASIEGATDFPPQPGSCCGICGYKDRCPIVQGFSGQPTDIVDSTSAAAAAAQLTAMSSRVEDLRRQLKAWCEGAGPVAVGDVTWGFKAVQSFRYPLKPLLAAAEGCGVKFDAVVQADTRAVKKIAGRDEQFAKAVRALAVDASYSRFQSWTGEGEGNEPVE